jgi:hypothetical protein
MSGNLQVPWRKSGVTSHSKNWQIWCSPWGGYALHYLMQLVATPDTDCFDFDFVQGHIIPFLLVTCLWNMFSLCLSCWILLCSYKYLHMLSLLKINAVDSERTFLYLVSLYSLLSLKQVCWFTSAAANMHRITDLTYHIAFHLFTMYYLTWHPKT